MARPATKTKRKTEPTEQVESAPEPKSPKLVVLSPHVVDEEEEPRGDRSLTEEALHQWTAGQKRCRARRRHNWAPFTVYEHRTYYDVVERCRDCLNRRHADFVKTNWGIRQESGWLPDYREGYLLPKGAAALDLEFRDGLVAADILSRRIMEVTDDEDAESGASA